MSSFSRLYAAYFSSPLPWFTWAALSVGLAVSGPFGSYEAVSLPVRLLCWSALVAATLVPGLAIRAWVEDVGARRVALVAAVVCGVLTLPVWALLSLGFGVAGLHPSVAEVAAVLFCGALGIALFRPDPEPSLPAPIDGMPRLLQRMDPADRGDLISITVRNHYVDVVTSAGPSSLLMRFSDAIEETAGAPGAQVHRSHWVAWAAVTGVERSEGKAFLVLVDGSRIPISRAHRAKVEARGLL